MSARGTSTIDAARELGVRRAIAEKHGLAAAGEGDLIAAVERSIIKDALEAGGNQTAAARILGISRYALRYRLGLRPPSVLKRLAPSNVS